MIVVVVSAVAWVRATNFFSDNAQYVSWEITPAQIDGYEGHLVVTLCPRTVHGPHKARMVSNQNSCSGKQHQVPSDMEICHQSHSPF